MEKNETCIGASSSTKFPENTTNLDEVQVCPFDLTKHYISFFNRLGKFSALEKSHLIFSPCYALMHPI